MILPTAEGSRANAVGLQRDVRSSRSRNFAQFQANASKPDTPALSALVYVVVSAAEAT
jgi:hypothetical protein